MIAVLFGQRPVEDLGEIVRDSFLGYGTAAHEFFRNRAEVAEMVRIQVDQLANQAYDYTRKPIAERLLANGTVCLIVEEFEMYMHAMEHRLALRLSTLLELMDGKWRVTHFHGSTPDSDIAEEEAFPMEGLKRKNEELEAKIKERTRELEIEAALERVRAQAMAMRQSDDLVQSTAIVFEELEKLELSIERSGIGIFNAETKECDLWTTVVGKDGKKELATGVTSLTVHPMLIATFEAWENQQPLSYVLEGKELADYYERVSKSEFVLSDEVIGKSASLEREFYYYAPFGAGGVYFFSESEPTSEELRIIRRFAEVFDLTYTRFLDLQKAEAQAREAQIEAALERVRSRSMAMHNSEELVEVATVLYNELVKLEVSAFSVASIVVFDERNNQQTVWGARMESEFLEKSLMPLLGDQVLQEIYDKWQSGEAFFSVRVGGLALENHKDFVFPTAERTELVDLALKNMPDPTYFNCAVFSMGYLELVADRELAEESASLLIRFAKVFDQSYTRFLDLQKAEAQAREAMIEMALERVRARSMAMQTSEELREVIRVIFEQLKLLNIQAEHAGIVLDYKAGQDWHFWVADKQDIPARITVPYLDLPWDRQFAEAKENGTDFFTTQLNFEEKNSFYQKLLPHIPGLTQEAQDFYFSCPGLAASTVVQEDIALYIENFSGTPYSEEDNSILRRFGKVFQQTYTRFLDLQKAEAQAREAQVELSLERIRAQVTAMTVSADLLDIVVTLRSEFGKLGHEAHYFWHMRWLPEGYEKAMTSGDGTRIGMVMKLPRHMHGDIPQIAAWEKGNDPNVVYVMDVEAAIEYVDKMVALGDFQLVDPNAPSHDDISHIGGLTFVMARTTHGEIGYSLPGIVPDPPAEDLETLVRFAGVFDLAYRRFEDLKASEQQIREARIETALERVRARALAMQAPEELKEVAQVLRQEMGFLGVEELETSSIYINDAEASQAECWYAIKDLREEQKVMVADHFALDLNATWVGREMLQFYESAAEQVSILMKGKQRREWIDYCEAHSEPFRGYYGEVVPDRTYHLYKFSHGAIGVATDGDLSDESWGLLRRAASVFSLAYSRFRDLTQARLDLQRLKEEKKRAEDALTELQHTQKQLVHAEKMASLGELTAGIAHEIQNPLNFVNNFSEVSRELLEEMLEELKKGDAEEADAIAKDVIENLEKIVHHGKRADGIVKGMLQHCRGGDGNMEPTDLNKLADEYLRLAYHGLRAKDKSFNAAMETDFDTGLPQVSVVPQDIGRVLLNLITNAFHAVQERKQRKPEGYEPTVWVKTRKSARGVEITVQDNGGGIPAAIKEKIFQPFFTTKPTGEGTGLGLSMSYDIVTKGHGGTLEVKTTEGAGSEFILTLPIMV